MTARPACCTCSVGAARDCGLSLWSYHCQCAPWRLLVSGFMSSACACLMCQVSCVVVYLIKKWVCRSWLPHTLPPIRIVYAVHLHVQSTFGIAISEIFHFFRFFFLFCGILQSSVCCVGVRLRLSELIYIYRYQHRK